MGDRLFTRSMEVIRPRLFRRAWLSTSPLLMIVTLLALALPSFGPLLDHHFAERQPNHGHLSAAHVHTHDHIYGSTHGHVHYHEGTRSEDAQTAAIYNYDGAPASTGVVVLQEAESESRLFEPGSIFQLPHFDDLTASLALSVPPTPPPIRAL